MGTYYKPQSPIQSGEDFIYPLTTLDQIMVDENTRLNAVGVYLKNIDDSTDTKKPQNPLTNNGFGIYPLTTADQVILSDGSRLEKNKQITANNSEKLGNVAASEYALKNDTVLNSEKLGGKTLAEIMLALYPVGAVYISANSTSPASLFGGTWERIKGRFLIGTEKPENNDDGTSPGNYNYAAGSKGGEETHKLSIKEIPSHAGHLYGNAGGLDGKGNAKGAWLKEININSSLTTSYGWNYKNNEYYPANRSLGGNAAHNNMPPYLAVYMWKRVN